jgi:hypothetical protein
VNDPQPDAEGDKLSLSEPVVLELTETEGEPDSVGDAASEACRRRWSRGPPAAPAFLAAPAPAPAPAPLLNATFPSSPCSSPQPATLPATPLSKSSRGIPKPSAFPGSPPGAHARGSAQGLPLPGGVGAAGRTALLRATRGSLAKNKQETRRKTEKTQQQLWGAIFWPSRPLGEKLLPSTQDSQIMLRSAL